MDQTWIIAILIGLALGALIARSVAANSIKKQRINGGAVAEAIHYIACLFLGSGLPYIITSLVLGLEFKKIFGTALAFIIIGALLVIAFATVESTAPEKKELAPTLD